MPSEAVRQVFARATDDPEFSTLLWSDPAEAGREMGLTGVELYEVVGAIEHANRSRDAGKRRLIVLKEAIDEKHLHRWPFDDLSAEDIAERGEVAEDYAEHLLRTIAFELDPGELLVDVRRWAEALEASLERRAEASATEVEGSVALALIRARSLLDAIERSKRAAAGRT